MNPEIEKLCIAYVKGEWSEDSGDNKRDDKINENIKKEPTEKNYQANYNQKVNKRRLNFPINNHKQPASPILQKKEKLLRDQELSIYKEK